MIFWVIQARLFPRSNLPTVTCCTPTDDVGKPAGADTEQTVSSVRGSFNKKSLTNGAEDIACKSLD